MVQTNGKPKRYRGYVLTQTGAHKLQNQVSAIEKQTCIRQSALTIARRVQLHHDNGIHPMTVRKIFNQSRGVDKSSIERVFQALDLSLEVADCAHASLVAQFSSGQSHESI